MSKPKISLVTAVYNGEKYIRSCIESVLAQKFDGLEYIVVDGGSTDGTPAILESFKDKIDILIQEKDEGIYDAINKGIRASSGEVVGILNSDDFFFENDVLRTIFQSFRNPLLEMVYGDLVIVDPEENYRLIRYYSGKGFVPNRLAWGDMPPHPTVYCRKRLFEQLGYYDKSFKIGGDFEFLVRALYIHRKPSQYLSKIMVVMRSGGVSTSGLKSTTTINREMQKALSQNGVDVPIWKLYFKYFWKVFQFFKKPKFDTDFHPKKYN